MGIPDRLVYVRKKFGYTRARLSEEIGVPYGTIAKYESGEREPGHTYIIKIADKFGVTTDYILGLEDEKTPLNPDGPDQGEYGRSLLSESAVEEILIQLGYIQPGDDLTDADLQFLLGIGQILEAWFSKSEESGSK